MREENDMNKYVLQHDFGYGVDSQNINKLCLRDIEDLKCYVNSLIRSTYVGTYDEGVLSFDDQCKVKITIEKL